MAGLEELSRLSKDERYGLMAVKDLIAVEVNFDDATKIAAMLDRRFNRGHEAVLEDEKVYVRRVR